MTPILLTGEAMCVGRVLKASSVMDAITQVEGPPDFFKSRKDATGLAVNPAELAIWSISNPVPWDPTGSIS
jgi:hypothetical protein